MSAHHHLFAAILLLGTGCASLPKETPLAERRIAVAKGPEDMVLDDTGRQKRILISCSDHRCEGKCPNGDILSYTPATGVLDTLERIGEPEGMVFRPHGIDLLTKGESTLLYVISHDNPANHHFIAAYSVENDGLHWLHNIESPHFRSPNAVTAMPDDMLYVSNDHWKRGGVGETIFKKPKSTVVCQHVNGEAHVVAADVAYGNGITQKNGQVFQAATTGNVVYGYSESGGNLDGRRVIAKVTGPDNLRWDGETILVACHLHSLDFLKHMKHPEHPSPTTVYRLFPDGRKPELLYANSGKSISGGSTALVVDGKLYISQVFEPWILEVDLQADGAGAKE